MIYQNGFCMPNDAGYHADLEFFIKNNKITWDKKEDGPRIGYVLKHLPGTQIIVTKVGNARNIIFKAEYFNAKNYQQVILFPNRNLDAVRYDAYGGKPTPLLFMGTYVDPKTKVIYVDFRKRVQKEVYTLRFSFSPKAKTKL